MTVIEVPRVDRVRMADMAMLTDTQLAAMLCRVLPEGTVEPVSVAKFNSTI